MPRLTATASLFFVVACAALGCGRDGAGTLCATPHLEQGQIALPHCAVPAATLTHECGPTCRQLTHAGGLSDDPTKSCITSQAFWWIQNSNLLRLDLASGRTDALLGPYQTTPPIEPTGVSCDGNEVLFSGASREPGKERFDFIARFRDAAAFARVLWSDPAVRRDAVPPGSPTLSSSWLGWTWSFPSSSIWAATAAAQNPLAVRSDLTPAGPVLADGDTLIFQAGIRLERMRHGMRQPEVLSPSSADQWSPTVSHGRVAWIDQRDDARGTRERPRNPQVYLLDAGSESPTRITRDAPAAFRAWPWLDDTWLVWTDTRNDPVPDRGADMTQYARADVYGYNLATRREVALVTSTVAILPRVMGGKVYFLSPSDGTHLDLFVQPMP